MIPLLKSFTGVALDVQTAKIKKYEQKLYWNRFMALKYVFIHQLFIMSAPKCAALLTRWDDLIESDMT